MIVLGRIAGAYGIRGAVRVFPHADDPQAWARMPTWWLGHEAADPAWQPHRVKRCRLHGSVLVAELEGLEDRDVAESLKGRLVGAPRSALPATAKDEYYWGDLIGLEVCNRSGVVLGRVAGLMETGANDVLRVVGDDGAERLLPFVQAVVQEVDLAGGRIQVDWEADW